MPNTTYEQFTGVHTKNDTFRVKVVNPSTSGLSLIGLAWKGVEKQLMIVHVLHVTAEAGSSISQI